MTPPESPDALLRRAADRLDGLEKAATPGPWSEPYEDEETPGYPSWWIHNGRIGPAEYAVLGTFSLNPNQKADAALIVALRPVAAPLAAHLRATADRWDADVILDRPESGEMQPSHPEAWWCASCGGAIDSPDYPGDEQRCRCGVWTEALALARAVLGETEEAR